MEIRNKIGFIIPAADLYYNHYKNVLEKLDKNTFDLIVFKGAKSIIGTLKEKNFNFCFKEDVLNNNIVYKYLVSNYHLGYLHHEYLGNFSFNQFIKNIGLINIRFMYSLGKSQWDFSRWNRLYDLILCYGPYEIDNLTFCKRAIKLPMGYPKLDTFFNQNIDKNYYLKRFRCCPDKKTIVWLPTHRALCSLKLFARTISTLSDQYNVIVKPHPKAFVHNRDGIKLLENLNFNFFIRKDINNIDNVALYAIADFIFADYGGSAFEAIYTDKNLLLLNVPSNHYEMNPVLHTGNKSSDFIIRDYIINIDYEDRNNIVSLLRDNCLWDNQKKAREHLRNYFFSPYYGNSSDIAAHILSNVEQIVKYNLRIRILKMYFNIALRKILPKSLGKFFDRSHERLISFIKNNCPILYVLLKKGLLFRKKRTNKTK